MPHQSNNPGLLQQEGMTRRTSWKWEIQVDIQRATVTTDSAQQGSQTREIAQEHLVRATAKGSSNKEA